MFKDDYQAVFSKVTASEETYKKVMDLPKNRKNPGRFLGKALIVAAVISTLAVMASGAESVGKWFLRYFSDNAGQSLTKSQVEYIEENAQNDVAVPVQTPTEADEPVRVEVKSALTDGKTAYLTLSLTIPENVELTSLDPEWPDPILRFREALLIPEDTTGLIIAPDGTSPDALCEYSAVEDNDGLDWTQELVFEIDPALEDPEAEPFADGRQWRMVLTGVELMFFEPDREDLLLSDQTWEFTLNFQQGDSRQVELVQEPIRLMASKLLRNEYTIEVELTSFTLSTLNFRTVFTPTDPTLAGELLDMGDVKIVMKDGREVTLLRLTSTASAIGRPIILEEVDHVLLADGTKLPMPEGWDR